MKRNQKVKLKPQKGLPDVDEITEQRDRAAEIGRERSSSYPGMTYEEGVRDALDWVLGDTDDRPIELPV